MIDRYTRPAMRKIWSDEQTFELWLRIEIAACEAWAKEGVISSEEMASIRQAKFNKKTFYLNCTCLLLICMLFINLLFVVADHFVERKKI